MSAEDQKAIAEFFERMRKLEGPRDPESERQINQLMDRYPETKYYITQMAFFLEHAQAELQNKVRELEWKLQNQQPAGQPATGGGGFLSNLFGGGGGGTPRNVMPPPAPIHAPGYRPGMFSGGGGGGFMSGALQTAAGVAGGMLLGNMLMSAFSPGIAEAAPVEEVVADDPAADDAGFDQDPSGQQDPYAQDAGYEEVPQTDDFGGDFGGFEEEI